MTIKELIKDNRVTFDSYRQGIFYYNIQHREVKIETKGALLKDTITYTKYQFPVPLEDVGTATLLNEDKAILYMRWIRKSLEDNTLTKIPN